jgi:hypothetical protein
LDLQDAQESQAFGIEVKTHWGECWEILEASKAIARESLPSWPRPAVKDISTGLTNAKKK